jgi:hypothetical protein
MSKNVFKSKLSSIWSQIKLWWRQPRPKPSATEQSIQADQAEMDWADDGGQIVPVNVDSQAKPEE